MVILADGRHVYGELLSPGFDVVPPSGSQRFARDSVWQIVLGTAVGDSTDLATGSAGILLALHAALTRKGSALPLLDHRDIPLR